MKLYLSLFSLMFFLSNPLNCQKKYLYKSLSTKNNEIEIDINARFARRFLNEKTFKAHYDNQIDISKLDEETLTAPFILSVISLVWASGETYYVKTLNRNLARSLKIIKEVYKKFYPQITWDGVLIADKLTSKNKLHTSQKNENDSLAMCFSGGLDSVYSSLALNHKKQGLITINGFSQECNQHRWPLIKKQVIDFAQRYENRKNYFITSNFREIITGPKLEKKFPLLKPWREFCQEALSLFGISLPILQAKNYNKFIIPSFIDWGKSYPWGSHPFIDNNLQFENITAEHHDYNISRLEKINTIVNLCKNGMKKPIIHTCRHSSEAKTCSDCHKSFMTINFLIANGENPQDYGYPINLKNTITKMKKIFSQRYPFKDFSIVKINKWEDLKKYAQEALNNNTKPELEDYFSYIKNLNFIKFQTKRRFWVLDFKKYLYFLDKSWQKNFLKTTPIREI